MRRALIRVRLKQEVLDPQGDAVRRALVAQGFDQVRDVRIGKLIEVELGSAPEQADAEIRAMCEKLLANPVIEDFEFELLDASA